MTDILIRGMEMPKSCIDCPIMVDRYDTDACALQSEEANEAFESWEDMRRTCPLLPLPEGHGRLGDLDSLRKEFPEPENWKDFAQAVQHITGILATIDNAPTIIPAEGGGEDGN